MKTFAERLKLLLNSKKLNASQFAREIGVTKSNMSKWLKDEYTPGLENLQSMSQKYRDINLDWLINGEGNMYASKDYEQKTETNYIEEKNLNHLGGSIEKLISQNGELMKQVSESLMIQKDMAFTQQQMVMTQLEMAQTQRLNSEAIVNLSRSNLNNENKTDFEAHTLPAPGQKRGKRKRI